MSLTWSELGLDGFATLWRHRAGATLGRTAIVRLARPRSRLKRALLALMSLPGPISSNKSATVSNDHAHTFQTIHAVRISDGPVIYPDMPGLEGELGDNIDGPSVIKVPAWLPNPLGKYYMYFAHHRGEYIRLAYADKPEGPWTVYGPGTLRLDQTSALDHIASPDVLVDGSTRRLIMYFHGPTEDPGVRRSRPYAQETFVATSCDGLNFAADPQPFGAPYLKGFMYRGATYGLGMADKKSAYPNWLRSGQFFRSPAGFPPFEAGPRIVDEMRHGAVLLRGDTLHVFYTIVGDAPERIHHVSLDLRPDWTEWTATAPAEVLRPEMAYEGADVPMRQSRGGMSSGRERALRDPGVLDDDGQVYLYYAVAGEKGIAVAKITLPESSR